MKTQVVSIGCVEERIFAVRGHRVMLDRDLAELYGVETRVLNQAVRTNIERFPEDFMFSLSRDEITRISQSVTPSSPADTNTLAKSLRRRLLTAGRSDSVLTHEGADLGIRGLNSLTK